MTIIVLDKPFVLWWEVLTVVKVTGDRLYDSRSFMLVGGSVDVQW
jgi:hypothetical protein